MPKRRDIEGELPTALATLAGFLGTLIVLLVGTWNGSRAWIVLMRGAITFFLVAGLFRFLTAVLLNAVRWKATTSERSPDVNETAEFIATHSRETTERVAS